MGEKGSAHSGGLRALRIETGGAMESLPVCVVDSSTECVTGQVAGGLGNGYISGREWWDVDRASGAVVDRLAGESLRFSPHVVVYPAGVQVRGFRGFARSAVRGGVRGRVRGFSRGSRRRFLMRLIGLDWRSYASVYWVTLTYHAFEGEWSEWKRHFFAFRRRLVRSGFMPSFATWRLEFQRRGAPHFHMMFAYDEVTDGACVARAVRDAWCGVLEAAGLGSRALWRHGTCVVPVRIVDDGMGQVVGYMLKEHGKVSQGVLGVGTGRVWGVWGKPRLGRVVSVELSPEQFESVCARVAEYGRVVRSRYMASVSVLWPSFTLLGNSDRLLEVLGVEGLERVPIVSDVVRGGGGAGTG